MGVLKLEKLDKNNKMREVGSIEIKDKTDESAKLYFYGDINSSSLGDWQRYYPDDKAPGDVKEFLDQLEDVPKIEVHINSGGGSVFGGIAIYNMLKRFSAEITVYVDGLAASIASVIAMAGDKIIIPANAQMMIHKPSSAAWGNADEMRKQAEVLDGCQKVILKTYMEHAKDGVTEEEIDKLINSETWKNGEEWQEYFDIEVSEKSEATAAASEYYEKYANLPKSLKKPKKTPETMDIDAIAKSIAEAVRDELKKKPKETPEDDIEEKKKEILADLEYI